MIEAVNTSSSARSELDTANRRRAEELIEAGLREAASISHPIVKGRHRAAWSMRLSVIAPERAAAMVDEFAADPSTQARLLLTVVNDRVERGDTDLEPHFTQTVEAARVLDADERLHVLNSLCEAAIRLADTHRETALALVRPLAAEARDLVVPDAEFQQFTILGCALVGEVLLLLDDPLGRELVEEAARGTAELPSPAPVLSFLGGALLRSDSEAALRLFAQVQDPIGRFEARLHALAQTQDAAVRERLIREMESDAAEADQTRGPELLARLANIVAAFDPAQARALCERTVSRAEESPATVRCLQVAGAAQALAGVDNEQSLVWFRQAEETALQADEPARRVAMLVIIANEMADPFPREAAEVFQHAVDLADTLTELWECAHFIDVAFNPQRSPYLDLRGTRPILERVLERIREEAAHIPGVLGMPDVARAMAQADPERAQEILREWFDSAREVGDTSSMTLAAVALHRMDAEFGYQALQHARQYLERHVDCFSMGEFCRQTTEQAPELVLELAPNIPDRRERADALLNAAAHLFSRDAERSLDVIRSMERPSDRSLGLLHIVDGLLQLEGRPEPQPLWDELP